MKRVQVDFNAQLEDGCVSLGVRCALRDIEEHGVQVGDAVVIHDDEGLEADAVVEARSGSKHLMARVVGGWHTIRDVEVTE